MNSGKIILLMLVTTILYTPLTVYAGKKKKNTEAVINPTFVTPHTPPSSAEAQLYPAVASSSTIFLSNLEDDGELLEKHQSSDEENELESADEEAELSNPEKKIAQLSDEEPELLKAEDDCASYQFPPSLTETLLTVVSTNATRASEQIVTTLGETTSTLSTLASQGVRDTTEKIHKNFMGLDEYCLQYIRSGELVTMLQTNGVQTRNDLNKALTALKNKLAAQQKLGESWVEEKKERTKAKIILANWQKIIDFYAANKSQLKLDPTTITECDPIIATAIRTLIKRKKGSNDHAFEQYRKMIAHHSSTHTLSSTSCEEISLPNDLSSLHTALFGEKPSNQPI